MESSYFYNFYAYIINKRYIIYHKLNQPKQSQEKPKKKKKEVHSCNRTSQWSTYHLKNIANHENGEI